MEMIHQLFGQVTSIQVTAFAAILSAFAAVIAAGAARRAAVASVRSTHRQAWIEALREDVAELLNQRIELSKQIGFDHNKNLVMSELAEERMERIRFLMFRIELRLNPTENRHRKLIDPISEAPVPPLNKQLSADIKLAAQAIIREEWKKASSGS